MPRTYVLTALLVAAVLTGSPAPAEADVRSCGMISSNAAPVHVKAMHGARCADARRVLTEYLESDAPCTGSACAREIGGWKCAGAKWFSFPRLASCSRGPSRVAAYSTAD
jgi:hypothetical protein